ncbi:MAG: hypothetical protein KJO11_11300 [Gemmatimonadetes bacterium]|nr:hypothetical protein [Gemmatimonadota bacterium]NNF38183.1 hypothetical protein [Gemmatimonadota bacterium]
MYYTIELWTPKQAWLDLSTEEREAYVGSIGPTMQAHAEMGITMRAMATNDADTDNRAPYTYFSIVEAPDEAAARTFEADVRAAGWYEYFDQVNVRGVARSVEEVIGEHIGM